MSLSDFQILQKLGDGSYSSVYKVKRTEDGQEYALKKVKISHLSDREKENALNEVRILASIKHKNVASYKQAFFDEPSSSLCIVMEYADNGDVFQKICQYQQGGNLFKEKVVWKIFIQTVRGLKALHDLKILHRDMKSANIFLFKDYTAKLGDLNVSKVAKKGLLYTQTGTPYYASPEVWKDQPYDCKSDIWSLGCVLYEMCALVPPFRADDMNGLFKRVLKGAYPQIPTSYSMDLRNIIKSLLQVNAAQRPTTEQILDMPIIVRRIKKYFKDETMNNSVMTAGGQMGDTESELLKTIKFSKNLFKLKLPPPTYDAIQFQTIPNQPFGTVTGVGKIGNSRNLGGNSTNQTMPTVLGAEKVGSLLPKIINTVNTSSRNNNQITTSHTQSTKSQAARGNLSVTLAEDDGPHQQEDDNYDQDMFEYEDHQKGSHLPHIQPKEQPHHHYMNPTQQYTNSIKGTKSRSYSGRTQTNPDSKDTTKILKIKAQQMQNQDLNDYSDVPVTYSVNTGRSKSNVSYGATEETPSHKGGGITIKVNPPPPVLDYRLSNPSPSQLQMLQENINTTNLSIQNSSSKQGTKGTGQQANLPHQHTPIDEKAELDSQYADDFESKSDQEKYQKKNKVVAIKSGKRNLGDQSVVIHNSIDQSLILNPNSKNRDFSQGSQNAQGPAGAGDVSMITNQSDISKIYKSKEPRKAANMLAPQSSKSIGAINHVSRELSRQPSDQSFEKSPGDNRSQQPSQLSKNQINKPSIINGVLQQAQAPIQPGNIQYSGIKKSPNIDRIVNIYSINATNRNKKKKFYMNMGAANTKEQPSLNDDIRQKLRALREGIGYYESKGSQNRVSNADQNSSFDTNPTSRNANNSSVLLPELKGSLSPPGNLYNQNNSLIGKKSSIDRILRGLSNESTTNLHRIYRKAVQAPQIHPADGISRISGISNDLTVGPRNHNVPLKPRPSNINVYRVGAGNSNSVITQNISMISGGTDQLDVQGKSVINK